ncbi:MAG TPA: TnsA endonuclease N-terminal domain-containing protein [Candidatus Lokiarchaeia archaeon]|nr:TnsA endonuclease N-terminal domain-containing protein [Candidatus Lokiarchaeia archaeon]
MVQKSIDEKNKLITTSRFINGKEFKYLRPIQVRTIPLTYGSNRGVMPSLKLEGVSIEYESQLERDFYYIIDHDPNCVDFQPQPWELTYINKAGKECTIVPDCWAIFKDGTQFLIEIKPEEKYRKLLEDENWNLKVKAIEDLCKKMSWRYQIITDKKIKCVRLDNIKNLLNAAKHFSPVKIWKDISSFNSQLEQFLKDSPERFLDIVDFLTPIVCLERAEVISLLKYKIYNFQLFINWNVPLEIAEISLHGEYPLPTYMLPESNQYGNNGGDDLSSDILQDEQFVGNEKDREVFEERINLITPIVNKFGKKAPKSDIKKYCDENKQSFARVYRWYLNFKKNGQDALYSKKNRRHAKSHIKDRRVEELLQGAIAEWNTEEWRQIKPAYIDFCNKCKDLGLVPISDETFRRWIRRLPAVERKGKYKPKTQIFIDRGLKATYNEARYPCSVIQMDHTVLDIRCLDSFTKQDYGRVHCTIGVDTFSRSIWTFSISFESPNQETVTKAILKGLSPKEQLKEWTVFQSGLIEKGLDPNQYHYSCSGYPTMIQVDNGKDFQAESVKNLCMSLNITLESRPVKTPEYGGFIESIWDTINDAIRNDQLPGCVYSKPKSREPCKQPKFQEPPGYDARKTSTWTIDQFGEWLFAYIVTRYSVDARARQNHSPDDVWNDGLRGDNYQPLGGMPRLLQPEDYKKLDYLSKIDANCILSARGLRYKNMLYTSDWLIDARKKKIVKDGETVEFKVSHDDIRIVWMLDPETETIETLEAYNYDGDDRIKNFILKGLGKIKGYRDFFISLKMVEYAKEIIGKSDKDMNSSSSVMDLITKKLAEKGKINKKDGRFIQTLAKTQDGKEEINLAGTIAQLDEQGMATIGQSTSKNTIIERNNTKNGEISPKESRKGAPSSPTKNWFEGIDEDQVIPLPTSWQEAKKSTIFSKYTEDDKK